MYQVRINFIDRTKYVGAMVRGLANSVGGFTTVSGLTDEVLETVGYYEFAFEKGDKAAEFVVCVRLYLSPELVQVGELGPELERFVREFLREVSTSE